MTSALRIPRALLLAAALALVTDDIAAQRSSAGGRIRERVGAAGAERGDASMGLPVPRDSLRVGEQTRTYIVRAPRGIPPRNVARSGVSLPLVIVLHGGGGNAQNAEVMTHFTDLVEREQVIVVYPDGAGRQAATSRRGSVRRATSPRAMVLPAMFTWNAGHCCAYAMKNDVDDVAFISALIDRIATEYPVDAKRIYVTGMSNGAMMSHRVGRELAARIAAIAPVVGTVFGDEVPPASPVSAIMINGLLDESVPAAGGPPGGLAKNQWDGTPTRPNEDQGYFWARADGCASTPQRSEQGQIVTWRWSCPRGLAVEVHQLRDGVHEWPGGPRGRRRAQSGSTSMNATEVIWAFFKAHPKVP